MSQVLERSEGFPVDGKVFEPPQQSKDLERSRFIAFIGSLIEPQTAQDRPWTYGGGLELHNPCLRFVKNFIRKGRLTPVLKDVHDWVTIDYWQKATDSDASYFPRPIPQGYRAPMKNEKGELSEIRPMMGKMARPGEQMDKILNGSENIFGRQRRGIVEIKALEGFDYTPQRMENGVVTDPNIWEIQTAIFPDYPRLPILLDDIERLLDDATIHTNLQSIVDAFHTSLDQFRDYAVGTVERTHYMMRESGGGAGGYIPRYTDMDFVLLEQLGMERQDIAIRRGLQPKSEDDFKAMFAQFIKASQEEKEALTAFMMSQVKPVDVNTMAAAPIDEKGYDGYPGASGYSGFSGEVLSNIGGYIDPMPEFKGEVVGQFVCDKCGRADFKSQPALNTHRNVWCGKEKEEVAEG